jgi:uncharacterized protein (DUF58 family)
VKEFELDPLSDVWIFLDMHADVHSSLPQPDEPRRDDTPFWVRPKEFSLPPSSEEYGVSVAASLAQHFLRRDRAVGLASYGQRREIIQADRGERQLSKMLETLAVLHAEGQVPLPELIRAEAQQLVRGTSVIIITPSNDVQWLLSARQMERAGLRIVAIVVDSGSFGGGPDAQSLASQLAATGTMTYLIANNDSVSEALSHQFAF